MPCARMAARISGDVCGLVSPSSQTAQDMDCEQLFIMVCLALQRRSLVANAQEPGVHLCFSLPTPRGGVFKPPYVQQKAADAVLDAKTITLPYGTCIATAGYI